MFNNFFQRKYFKLYGEKSFAWAKQSHNAAKVFDIVLIGTRYDVFAADVYYYKICYKRFKYEYQKKANVTSFNETNILHYFLCQMEFKVIKDYESFLVNELMQEN